MVSDKVKGLFCLVISVALAYFVIRNSIYLLGPELTGYHTVTGEIIEREESIVSRKGATKYRLRFAGSYEGVECRANVRVAQEIFDLYSVHDRATVYVKNKASCVFEFDRGFEFSSKLSLLGAIACSIVTFLGFLRFCCAPSFSRIDEISEP